MLQSYQQRQGSLPPPVNLPVAAASGMLAARKGWARMWLPAVPSAQSASAAAAAAEHFAGRSSHSSLGRPTASGMDKVMARLQETPAQKLVARKQKALRSSQWWTSHITAAGQSKYVARVMDLPINLRVVTGGATVRRVEERVLYSLWAFAKVANTMVRHRWAM